MAAVTITVGQVKRSGDRGFEVPVTDSRGLTESLVFASRADARSELRALIDSEEVKRLLALIVVARGLDRGLDDADDLDSQAGRTITMNLRAAANIVRIA